MARAMTSVTLPAEKGVRMRMGRSGYAAVASPAHAAAAHIADKHRNRIETRMNFGISPLESRSIE
jgi:hypothetical protein